MFDAMKFSGDKIKSSELGHTIDVTEILGVYPVRLERDEDGKEIFVVSDEPTGKLLIYRAEGRDCAMYIENSVETSCLVDLL